jgi:arylsulfatase
MMGHTTLKTLSLAVVVAALLTVASMAYAADTKPNIVFILTDNLGYCEIGIYGGGVTRDAPTPRIDKIASEGLRPLNKNMETQCTRAAPVS